MALRYLTEPWAEEALRRFESDEDVLAAVDGIEVSLLTIILGVPADAYGFIYAAFDGNGLKEYRVGKDYAAVSSDVAAPTFVVSGNYEVFSAIQRGDLSERRALLTGRLHLTGSMVKALRYMRALESITHVLQGIECET